MNELNISFAQNITRKPDENTSQTQFGNSTSASAAEISVFLNDDTPPDEVPVSELTKQEKKALKKQQKAEAKAERERIRTTPDGIIQGGRQGSTAGDCWLLAEMNSMAKTDWGKEAFKNGISTDEDGNYIVHFKGVHKDIKITKEDFKKAQNDSDYSSNDADALLYEIAVERHFQEENINNGSIKGNDLAGEDSLQYLLTGRKGRQVSKVEQFEPILKAMGEKPENNNGISATYIYHDNNPDNVGDIDHAMSVQQVLLDENGGIDKVIVLDSYHPDKPQTLSYKTFKNNVKLFGYVTTPKENK